MCRALFSTELSDSEFAPVRGHLHAHRYLVTPDNFDGQARAERRNVAT